MWVQVPILKGLIERRILVNFRVDPAVLTKVLPHPFRPKLINGLGMAGICLIRLKQIRPRWLPAWFGLTSENAAHRIAVEWQHDGQTHQGVFIPRRDTASRINTVISGNLFPGLHHHAGFQVQERGNEFSLRVDSDDGLVHVAVDASVTDDLPATSIFQCLQQASDFFERGSLGYSVGTSAGVYDGLELRTISWRVLPLAVSRVESSYFGDRGRFPVGSVHFDSALLMRDVEHKWHGRKPLVASQLDAMPTAGQRSSIRLGA